MRKTITDTFYGAVTIVLAMSALYFYVADQRDKEHVSVVIEDVPLIVSAGM